MTVRAEHFAEAVPLQDVLELIDAAVTYFTSEKLKDATGGENAA